MEKKIKKILETPFWLKTLTTMSPYVRTHDDCDGELEQALTVVIAEDGDIHLAPNLHSLRFRTYIGGGMSLRTRNALLILAEAIRLDNEDRPQRP